MTIVDFSGTLQVVQDFTANADLLEAAVSGVKNSAVDPNAQAPPRWLRLGFLRASARSRALLYCRRFLPFPTRKLSMPPGLSEVWNRFAVFHAVRYP
jgi:hypothetical protein